MHWDRHRHELLTELPRESAQRSLLGLEHLGFVLLETELDVVHALDHDAPEQGGEFARQRDVGDEAAATRGHAPVEAAQGDVLAARQASRDHAEEPSGAVAAALGRTLALAALMAAGRQSHPGGEVFFSAPFGEIGSDFSDDLQDAVFGVRR